MNDSSQGTEATSIVVKIPWFSSASICVLITGVAFATFSYYGNFPAAGNSTDEMERFATAIDALAVIARSLIYIGCASAIGLFLSLIAWVRRERRVIVVIGLILNLIIFLVILRAILGNIN